jgi:hypothetical protein
MLAGTLGWIWAAAGRRPGVIVTAFVAAWLISRASGIVAEFAVRRYERRQLGDEAAPADTACWCA